MDWQCGTAAPSLLQLVHRPVFVVRFLKAESLGHAMQQSLPIMTSFTCTTTLVMAPSGNTHSIAAANSSEPSGRSTGHCKGEGSGFGIRRRRLLRR